MARKPAAARKAVDNPAVPDEGEKPAVQPEAAEQAPADPRAHLGELVHVEEVSGEDAARIMGAFTARRDDTGLPSASEPLPPVDDEGSAEDGIALGRVILVRSIAPSRRRAGIGFTRTPIPVEIDDLTDVQIAALLGDPELVIESGD